MWGTLLGLYSTRCVCGRPEDSASKCDREQPDGGAVGGRVPGAQVPGAPALETNEGAGPLSVTDSTAGALARAHPWWGSRGHRWGEAYPPP